ncbi:hypothetical protein MTO96_031841 [Rhipicephalus appendiculatus]
MMGCRVVLLIEAGSPRLSLSDGHTSMESAPPGCSSLLVPCEDAGLLRGGWLLGTVNEYYAGSDRWVDKESWDLLMKAPTDSMFCRSAAMLYWSPEQLRNRSVTGTLSNKCRALEKTMAKPALTPEKVSSLNGMLNRLKMSYHR